MPAAFARRRAGSSAAPRAARHPGFLTLCELALEQHELLASQMSPTNLAVAAGAIQALSRDLADRRIQPQSAVAKFARALLKTPQHGAPEALPLKADIHPHPLDLRDRRRHTPQRTHRHDLALDDADEEVATTLQIARSD